MSGLRWPLQEQESGEGAQGGADPVVPRKQYVEQQLEERYKPREVRELLARHGDKAEIALEHVVKEHNEMVQRLMKKSAELQYDLEAAQAQIKVKDADIHTARTERDALKAQIDEAQAAQRGEQVKSLLSDKFPDPVIARRHRAYLKDLGYELDVQGEGDKARLVVVKGDQRHNFETVVNDKFYEMYDDARPAGDTPIPPGGGSQPPTEGGSFDALALVKMQREAEAARAKAMAFD